MKDNKSRDIFYAVVAIATLVVALIGATLAYFSMTASSGEGAVGAQAAVISVDYVDGQSVFAKADNLIPISFDDMEDIYEANLTALNAKYQEYTAIIDNVNSTPEEKETALAALQTASLCKDTRNGSEKGYDVCSIYRFSVSNPTPTSILGTLRTESNGFTNLAYAVRNVTTNAWIAIGSGTTPNFKVLDKCTTEAPCVTDGVYSDTNPIAKNPIFTSAQSITSTRQTYDVVLFINEKYTAQDEDQGQTFTGNLLIESTGGEKISGSNVG